MPKLGGFQPRLAGSHGEWSFWTMRPPKRPPGKPKGVKPVSTFQETIVVDAPLRTTYNQWTQFESFPHFMEGVDRIEQVTDTRTHWVTNINGVRREFDAEIVEQRPDERVAWMSTDPPRQTGAVTFEPVDPERTRIHLQMDFEPEGAVEKTGDRLGLIKRRIQGDLNRFKKFIESRGRETGAWRGKVEDGQAKPTYEQASNVGRDPSLGYNRPPDPTA